VVRRSIVVDATAGSRERTGSRAWWLVAALLIGAFLARAPLYLSVFPPFEGWDEHQHLAYIVHVDETGSIPVLNDSVVARGLRPLTIALPHSPAGANQLRQWGALPYSAYWKATAPPADADREASFSFRLYQAQHPPLAYVLAVPIWRALKTTHPLEAIYAIRAINVLLVAAALVPFAAALTRLVPAFAPRVAVFALVCLHPLFFQNVARVANDALAVATGVAGISLLVLAREQTLLTRGVLASACIAASVWSKQTSLTLIPPLVLGLPLIGWSHNVSTDRLRRAASMAGAAFLLLVAPLWLWSYQHYGAITTQDHSVELAARGPVVPALATALVKMSWRPLVHTHFVPGTPWVGGWSYLPVHETLAALHGWCWGIVLAGAGVGAVVALRRARAAGHAASILRTDGGAAAGLVVCAAVVIFTTLGMMYYSVLSYALFGQPMTNPWYFMTALPFLFVLLVRGLEAIDRRLAAIAAAVLAVLFVAIDLHGTWVQMPRSYASTTDAALQWSRLTTIHPAILSGDLRWLFLAMYLGALCLVVGALMYAWRDPRVLWRQYYPRPRHDSR
jgi:hypothetical protein